MLFVNNVLIDILYNRGQNSRHFVKIALTDSKKCAILKGMDTTILRKAGLTESAAKGYLALIEHGSLSPTELAEHTGENRTNAYAIADKLVSLGLATKRGDTKASYQPESPAKLKQLLITRQRELKAVDSELSGILPQLLSTFRLTTDKPGVLHLEGVDSLRQVYDDIIKTGDTLCIFPSSHDRDDPEIAAMIDSQIERQRKAGIKTEVLLRQEVITQFAIKNDELFEARPAPLAALDAQIMVYGDNVAITIFGSGVVTTIITSPPAAQTFRQLFLGYWGHSTDHDTTVDTQND